MGTVFLITHHPHSYAWVTNTRELAYKKIISYVDNIHQFPGECDCYSECNFFPMKIAEVNLDTDCVINRESIVSYDKVKEALEQVPSKSAGKN